MSEGAEAPRRSGVPPRAGHGRTDRARVRAATARAGRPVWGTRCELGQGCSASRLCGTAADAAAVSLLSRGPDPLYNKTDENRYWAIPRVAQYRQPHRMPPREKRASEDMLSILAASQST